MSRDVWLSVPDIDFSAALENFYQDSRYPDNPTVANEAIDDFQTPSLYDDNYAQRLRAYLVAPETGDYTFSITCNRECEVWLSTDATPESKQKLVFVQKYNPYDTFFE